MWRSGGATHSPRGTPAMTGRGAAEPPSKPVGRLRFPFVWESAVPWAEWASGSPCVREGRAVAAGRGFGPHRRRSSLRITTPRMSAACHVAGVAGVMAVSGVVAQDHEPAARYGLTRLSVKGESQTSGNRVSGACGDALDHPASGTGWRTGRPTRLAVRHRRRSRRAHRRAAATQRERSRPSRWRSIRAGQAAEPAPGRRCDRPVPCWHRQR